MNILAVDQSMQSSGWSYEVCGDILAGGFIKTDDMTDLAAMQYQRDRIRYLISRYEPNLVVLEGVHYRKSVSTSIKLGGLLYMIRDLCDSMHVPHTVKTSQEIHKHLHLAIARTNSKKKHDRAVDFAGSLVWGNINLAPGGTMQDDLASSIVMLDCQYYKEVGNHLICNNPARAFDV